MTSILILDATQRSALAAARAIGSAGYEVHVGASSSGLCAASRHISASFVYSDPAVDAQGAADQILRYTAANNIDVLMPMTDVTNHLVLTVDTALPPSPCPPMPLYDHASDKGRLTDTARACGIPVPQSVCIHSRESLANLPRGFEFPVVLKPTRSRIARDAGYMATSVAVAHDLQSFLTIQRDKPWFTEAPWLLQSFIEGTGHGVFSIYDHGRPVAWFAHERIREKPPTGGVSVLSRSAPLSPRLKNAAKTLLDALEWHGPAMVEFRVTADGTPYLMEINARFWGSLQLAVSSGVNFPLLAAQIAMGEHPEPVEDYKLGVYNRWLLGDLDNLYLTLKAPPRDFSLGQKLAAIGKFMIPWWPGLHYEVNQWDDMGPFWHELKHYLR